MRTFAFTLWQPWASLAILDLKPFEFRGYPLRPSLIGARVVVHAAKRPLKAAELRGILDRLYAGHADGMKAGPAIDLLESVWRNERELPFSAALGTVELGQPMPCTKLFPNDKDVDPGKWAWPMSKVRRWPTPYPISGAQGFWIWNRGIEDGQ